MAASMSAPTPWPHEWRSQMRLLPSDPAGTGLVVCHKVRLYDGHYGLVLWCSRPGERVLYCVAAADPGIQPDLDDDGTVGVLLGMVREALRTSDDWQAALNAETYVLECDEEFGTEDDGPVCGWFEPCTCKSYEGQGEAYKAALDHLKAIR